MSNIMIVDTSGQFAPDESLQGGGNVQRELLASALCDYGNVLVLDCPPQSPMSVDALILWGFTEPCPTIRAKRTVRAPHHGADSRYDRFLGDLYVCVSKYQAQMFEARGCRTTVIYPIVGDHVPHAGEIKGAGVGLAIFAGAVDKGLDATLEAWEANPIPNHRLIVATRYGLPSDAQLDHMKWLGAGWLHDLPYRDLVKLMAKCSVFYMRNGPSYELFPVTLAIARKLGLALDVKCVGHPPCGIEEAKAEPLHHLEPPYVAEQWAKALGLV